MLTLNDEVIARDKLCEKFGIDYKKIEKRPEFEGLGGWTDHANGGKKRFNGGYSKLARFWVEDKATKMPLEIRYSVSRVYRKEMDGYDYQPKRIEIPGEGMQLSEDLDLAVFTFLHPSCALSPFRKGKSNFEFVDAQARAEKEIDELDTLGEALVHAKSISGHNAVILAKGLGIAGVDTMEPKSITAALMKFAQQNPAIYLQKKDQQLTMIEGRIEHFIDKGIFDMQHIGQVRRWVWKSGEREGQTIVDVFNTTANAREALKNHIKQNMAEYMFELNNMGETVSANEAALNYLNSIKDESGESIGNNLPAHLANIGKNGMLPTNFNEATNYLTRLLEKRPSNPVISKFLKSVQEEGLTEEGVNGWIEENIKK